MAIYKMESKFTERETVWQRGRIEDGEGKREIDTSVQIEMRKREKN